MLEKDLNLLSDFRNVESLVDVIFAGWHGDSKQKPRFAAALTVRFESLTKFLKTMAKRKEEKNR
jgi:hypothetical protein